MENNNDKAKKILFGRTDIDHENAATEALKKLKQDNPEDFKPQSQWNDPEMTGLGGLPKIDEPILDDSDVKAWTEEDHKRAIENIEFVKPDFDSKAFDGEKFDARKIEDELRFPKATPKEIIDKFNNTRLEFGNPVKPINWHEEHERFDQINRVLDYCNKAGISPDDLIDCYSEHHTLPPKE